MISERIKAALAVIKERGQVLGFATRSPAQQRRLRSRARAGVQRAARDRAEAYRVHIEWALRQPAIYGTRRPISFRAAANQLNARHLPSPYGRRWDSHQLMQMARRLGLDHPRGHLLRAEAQALVQTLWKRYPHYTGTYISCPALAEQERPSCQGTEELKPEHTTGVLQSEKNSGILSGLCSHRSRSYPHWGSVP